MRVVILGAGPAGLTVAERVRGGDPAAEVTLISAERSAPYAPPAMADHFAGGNPDALYWKPVPAGVTWRAGAQVVDVHPERREVTLAGGETLPWDRLVIATGAALHAPLPGVDLPGVYDFKSLAAAESLMERVHDGTATSAVVVGAGFIGLEVALLLADLGVAVTIVERDADVMPRALDAELAAIVRGLVEARGVTLRRDTTAQAFEGDDHVVALRLESGERLVADVYVAATGVKPNIDFLHGSGIRTAWGVIVDDHLQTNVPGVYACGDVAETHDRLTGARFVHANFPNAVAQAHVVADNLLGNDVAYDGAESMNSLKHLGLPVLLVGAADGPETLRWQHGDVLRKVFLDGDRIVGFRLVGDLRGCGFLRALLLRGADVTPWRSHLADPSFGPADLVA